MSVLRRTHSEEDGHTLVLATYEALTVDMTAFIRFLAAVIRDVALSNYKIKNMTELVKKKICKLIKPSLLVLAVIIFKVVIQSIPMQGSK